MDYVLPVFYAVLQLILLLGVGFAARRTRRFSDEFFKNLSRFVVRIALPLFFVARVGRADLSALTDALVMPLASIGIIALSLGLSLLFFLVLPFRGADRRAGVALSTFGNSGYMPLTLATVLPASLPALESKTGSELPLILIAAYVLLYSPLLWSVGRYTISRTEEKQSFRAIDLLSPPLVGIILGGLIALSGLQPFLENRALPFYHLFSAIDLLSGVTLPLALVSLGALIGGLEISRDALHHYLGMALSVAVVRYVMLPALFFGALLSGLFGGLGAAALFVIFLEMHTPPATNLSLIATESGVNREHAAVTLLVSYLLYLILMPGYLVLFLSQAIL